MRRPIHAAESLPPLPPGTIPRPRLDSCWRDWETRRLVLVTAGAGFGKTTFLLSSARSGGRPVHWLSLEEADADPAVFLARLKRLIPSYTSENGSVLVLDDLQLVVQDAAVIPQIEHLIATAPHGHTIVLCSREPIGIRVSRLRSQGMVASLGTKELRFTAEELERLLVARFPGIEPDADLVKRILARTEGWATGIEILLQACPGSSLWALRQAVDGSLPAREGWFAYFAEEVLHRLEARVREFVRRASLFPRLEPALCNRALRIRDGAALLRDLCERNLFTFRDGDRETYRFHHLFREALRRQLARETAPAELRTLQLRVARTLARAGQWAEAASVYAEAGDPDAAIEAIECCGPQLLAVGQYRAIDTALRNIPRKSLLRRPKALTVHGRLLEVRGQWDDARALYRRALAQSPPSGQIDELMSLLAQIHVRKGEYAACRALCRKALKTRGNAAPRVRATLLCLLGLTSTELGRLDEAEKQFRAAITLCRRSNDRIGEGRALFLLAANVHHYRGDLRRARETAREAILVYERAGDQRGLCHAICVLAYICLPEGDATTARDLANTAIAMAENLGYLLVEGMAWYVLGGCALLERDPRTARRHLESALRIDAQIHEPFVSLALAIAMAEMALAEGNRRRASLLANKVLERLRTRPDRYQEGLCRALLGLAEETTRPRKADEWWRSAEVIFRSMGARFQHSRILLLRLDLGRMPAAEREPALRELLSGVAEREQEFLFLRLEPERAARVLADALREGIERDYAISLLTRLAAGAVPALSRLADDAPGEVRETAIDLLARIGGAEAESVLTRIAASTTKLGKLASRAVRRFERRSATALEVHALGPFSVAMEGSDLLSHPARSAQQIRLLQFLLVRRFAWVPKEEILETFWPDTDPEKSNNSLRQCVHVLRKILEPARADPRISSYIRFAGGAYRLDPGEGHFYDVESFEREAASGLRLVRENRPSKAESSLAAAVELYRGPFLEEHPYEDFAAAERERLRDLFLVALRELLALVSAGDRWEESIPLARRALVEDPFNEDFHADLLRAHLKLGNRKEALEIYHRYERMMARELNLPPSSRLRALAGEAASLRGSPKLTSAL